MEMFRSLYGNEYTKAFKVWYKYNEEIWWLADAT
jgi:hypothetical protein